VKAALGRADGDRIDHKESLEPRLDGEQSGDAVTHAHGKANVVPMAGFRRF
jgi:hypothetical protein